MDNASSSNGKSKVTGIPTRCWCEAVVVPLISKSDRNPHRRYFRCSKAVVEKLCGDNHTFKWVDEALVDEVESLHNSIDRVENLMMDQLESLVMNLAENLVMERVEHLVKERVDRLVTEKLDKLVTEKLEKMVMEKLDKIVMEKVQEEILCMRL